MLDHLPSTYFEVRSEPDDCEPVCVGSIAAAERVARNRIHKGRSALVYEVDAFRGERFLFGEV